MSYIVIKGTLFASGLFYIYNQQSEILSESMSWKEAESILGRIYETGPASVRIGYIGKIKNKSDYERVIPFWNEKEGRYDHSI